jgi:hypothetical protein
MGSSQRKERQTNAYNKRDTRGAGGLEMGAGKIKSDRRCSRVDHITIVDEALGRALNRRAVRPTIRRRRYLSEDYAFCRRWRDMGGKVWVDLNCKLTHMGQHLFGGDLAESLRVQGRW